MRRLKTTRRDTLRLGRRESVEWESPSTGLIVSSGGLSYGNPVGAPRFQRRAAVSRQTAAYGDFAVEFNLTELRPAHNGGQYSEGWVNSFVIGLSDASPNTNEDAIRWGLMHAHVGKSYSSGAQTYDEFQALETGVYVRELGVNRAVRPGLKLNSRLRIAIEDGVVNYYADGERFYQSTESITYPVKINCVLMSEGASVSGVEAIYEGRMTVGSAISMPFFMGGVQIPQGYYPRSLNSFAAGEWWPYRGQSTSLSTSVPMLHDLKTGGDILVKDYDSKVLVWAEMNGLRKLGGNIGGRFRLYSLGRSRTPITQGNSALSSAEFYEFGDPITGPILENPSVNGASSYEERGGLFGHWLDTPFEGETIQSWQIQGTPQPEGSTIGNNVTPSMGEFYRANYSLGVILRLQNFTANAPPGIFSANVQGVSKITLVEFARSR